MMGEFFSSFLLITGWLVLGLGLYFFFSGFGSPSALFSRGCIVGIGGLMLFISKKLDSKTAKESPKKIKLVKDIK
ncbi:hypothetical protein NST21_28200 [Peribacillus sp. FSL K6-1552]|uniref:hypothetical protein n=1 Tax=Peribacillus sp. FSL K6-1552 TaxID=2954514 RepID=UPI0030F8F4B0